MAGKHVCVCVTARAAVPQNRVETLVHSQAEFEIQTYYMSDTNIL